MKIRPVGIKWFRADGQTDRQTWRRQQSNFAILRTRLKMNGQSQLRNRVWKESNRIHCPPVEDEWKKGEWRTYTALR